MECEVNITLEERLIAVFFRPLLWLMFEIRVLWQNEEAGCIISDECGPMSSVRKERDHAGGKGFVQKDGLQAKL